MLVQIKQAPQVTAFVTQHQWPICFLHSNVSYVKSQSYYIDEKCERNDIAGGENKSPRQSYPDQGGKKQGLHVL